MLQLVIKLQWTSSCFLWMKKVVSWDRISPGENAVKTIEMTTKNLEQYIHLADKAVAGFERMDFNFESISAVSKMSSNSIVCYREIICKRKSQSVWQTSLLSYFKKLSQPLPWSVSNHRHVWASPSTCPKVTMTCWRLRWWLAFFSNKVFLN